MSRQTSNTPKRVRISWRFGRIVALIMVTAAAAAAGIYQVNERYAVVQLGYQLDNDHFEYRRLLETNKRLRLSISSYEDPQTIKEMGEYLGMRPAERRDELVVPHGEHTPFTRQGEP
jgi:hypothetical protein